MGETDNVIPAIKERTKHFLGSEHVERLRSVVTRLRMGPLLARMRMEGWTPQDLEMSDAQAAIHFANESEMDLFNRTVARLFHQFKIKFITESLGREFLANNTILEIGDSDGLLLKALGKSGSSINNDPRCVALIRSNGIDAKLGVGERIEAEDRSYDVTMSFETLEHSLNPVAFLQEMSRVARKKVIISVPGVTRTIIHPRVQGLRVGEEHVFELASGDLKLLATHLPLKLTRFVKMPVFAAPQGPLSLLHYYLTRNRELFGGCFRWYDLYAFDVVDTDQGVTRVESEALYSRRR
ncbi:MAG TPA: methyltransferase domain-containing protein [Thermoanaerobaculia bacterium]|nr:methyltransferase domain-containing protein [Thermoanaerobaculia bacterium]